MVGTIVNTCCIIAGSILGAVLKKGIKPQYQEALFNAMGIASLALGANACVHNLPKSTVPVLFIISLAVGSLVGYMLKLDDRFSRLVNRGDGSGRLAEGLSTGILLYCIGTFSMLGPVLSALHGDNTYLFTNATLDFCSSMVLASTFGIGMIWAAPVLFCWQGMFYAIAFFFGSAMPEPMRTELSIVGGVLIVSSGLAILGIKDLKTVNLLPSLLVPVLFYLIKGLFV